MKFSFRWIPVLIIMLIAPVSSFSQHIKDLYVGKAVVTAQSSEQQQQALQDALGDVLVKVSGNVNVTQVAKVREQLATAEQWVDQYGYEEGAKPNQQSFVARFEPTKIHDILRTAGQAIWRQDRPLVTLWLVTAKDDDRQVLAADSSELELTQALEQSAKQRGLAVLLPLYDLQDMAEVSVDDVWAPFPWRIQGAAKRYGSEAELIGKLVANPDAKQGQAKWQGQWLLLLDGTKMSWQSQAASAAELAHAAINEAADAMAARYAVLNADNEASQLALAVQGVSGLDNYARLATYLRSLAAVTQLEVLSVDGDKVVFELTVLGGEQTLSRAFAADHMLLPLDTGYQGETEEAGLSYRLIS